MFGQHHCVTSARFNTARLSRTLLHFILQFCSKKSVDVLYSTKKCECTMDQELETELFVGSRRTLRVHSPGCSTFLREMTSWRDWRHLESVAKFDSVNRCATAHSLEEQPCQISSRSDSKRRSLGHFWRGRPNKKNRNKMISDMRSGKCDQFLLIQNDTTVS